MIGWLRSFTYLLPRLLGSLLTRPGTISYPFAPLELSPHFRGRVIVDAVRCRGCGRCVRDCPAFALELERQDRDTYRLIYHPDRCAYCGQCELSCPFGAITQHNEFVPAAPCRESLAEVVVERAAGHRPTPQKSSGT